MAMNNLCVYKNPQSIVITGESGSGKTETTKHLLKFLCGSVSEDYADHMINANVLLEAFGNASTPSNANSSRFIKTAQVIGYLWLIHDTFQPILTNSHFDYSGEL